jgi:hypothetical protein
MIVSFHIEDTETQRINSPLIVDSRPSNLESTEQRLQIAPSLANRFAFLGTFKRQRSEVRSHDKQTNKSNQYTVDVFSIDFVSQ